MADRDNISDNFTNIHTDNYIRGSILCTVWLYSPAAVWHHKHNKSILCFFVCNDRLETLLKMQTTTHCSVWMLCLLLIVYLYLLRFVVLVLCVCSCASHWEQWNINMLVCGPTLDQYRPLQWIWLWNVIIIKMIIISWSHFFPASFFMNIIPTTTYNITWCDSVINNLLTVESAQIQSWCESAFIYPVISECKWLGAEHSAILCLHNVKVTRAVIDANE